MPPHLLHRLPHPQQPHPHLFDALLAALQRLPQAQKIGVVRVDQVEQLPADEGAARAQVRAQVAQRLVAVRERGEVCAGGEGGGGDREGAAGERLRVGQVGVVVRVGDGGGGEGWAGGGRRGAGCVFGGELWTGLGVSCGSIGGGVWEVAGLRICSLLRSGGILFWDDLSFLNFCSRIRRPSHLFGAPFGGWWV